MPFSVPARATPDRDGWALAKYVGKSVRISLARTRYRRHFLAWRDRGPTVPKPASTRADATGSTPGRRMCRSKIRAPSLHHGIEVRPLLLGQRLVELVPPSPARTRARAHEWSPCSHRPDTDRACKRRGKRWSSQIRRAVMAGSAWSSGARRAAAGRNDAPGTPGRPDSGRHGCRRNSARAVVPRTRRPPENARTVAGRERCRPGNARALSRGERDQPASARAEARRERPPPETARAFPGSSDVGLTYARAGIRRACVPPEIARAFPGGSDVGRQRGRACRRR